MVWDLGFRDVRAGLEQFRVSELGCRQLTKRVLEIIWSCVPGLVAAAGLRFGVHKEDFIVFLWKLKPLQIPKHQSSQAQRCPFKPKPYIALHRGPITLVLKPFMEPLQEPNTPKPQLLSNKYIHTHPMQTRSPETNP